MAVVLSLAGSPALGYVDFDDGLVHDIDYEISDSVRVDYGAPGMETTVNLLASGSMISLNTYEDSQINILGGSIEYPGGLSAKDSSQVDISGGSIGYVGALNSSQVDISGGSVAQYLVSTHFAILTIHGSDFVVDGFHFGYGELTSIYGRNPGDDPPRRLTGTLASGEPIDNDFQIGNAAKIVLVPEPATVALLGLGALSLIRRRRA